MLITSARCGIQSHKHSILGSMIDNWAWAVSRSQFLACLESIFKKKSSTSSLGFSSSSGKVVNVNVASWAFGDFGAFGAFELTGVRLLGVLAFGVRLLGVLAFGVRLLGVFALGV